MVVHKRVLNKFYSINWEEPVQTVNIEDRLGCIQKAFVLASQKPRKSLLVVSQ